MSLVEGQKTALVTGGTRGIGLGIIHALSEADVLIATCGQSWDSISKFEKDFHGVHTYKFDLSQYSAAQNLGRLARKGLGGSVDLLILNAGVHGVAIGKESPEEEVARRRHTIAVNTIAPVALIREVEAETIVLVTSALADPSRRPPEAEYYGKSKQLLEEYLRRFYLKSKNRDVNIIIVNPGPTDTRMHDEISEKGPANLAALSRGARAAGRLADPMVIGSRIAQIALANESSNPNQIITL